TYLSVADVILPRRFHGRGPITSPDDDSISRRPGDCRSVLAHSPIDVVISLFVTRFEQLRRTVRDRFSVIVVYPLFDSMIAKGSQCPLFLSATDDGVVCRQFGRAPPRPPIDYLHNCRVSADEHAPPVRGTADNIAEPRRRIAHDDA